MKGFDFEILWFLKRKLTAFGWVLKRNSSRRFYENNTETSKNTKNQFTIMSIMSSSLKEFYIESNNAFEISAYYVTKNNIFSIYFSVSLPQKSANGGTEKIQKLILSQQIIPITSSSANANIPKNRLVLMCITTCLKKRKK